MSGQEPLIDVFIRILAEHGYGILAQADLDTLNTTAAAANTWRQRAEEAEECLAGSRTINEYRLVVNNIAVPASNPPGSAGEPTDPCPVCGGEMGWVP